MRPFFLVFDRSTSQELCIFAENHCETQMTVNNPKTGRRHRNVKTIVLDDIRPFAADPDLLDEELIFVDDLHYMVPDHDVYEPAFLVIAYCTAGEANFEAGGLPCRLQSGDMFFSFGHRTLAVQQLSQDVHLKLLAQNLSFVQESILSMLHLWPYLLKLMEHPVLTLDGKEQEELEADFEQLRRRLKGRKHTFRREEIKASLQALYLDVCHFLQKRSDNKLRAGNRAETVFYKFMLLLSRNVSTQRELGWYADQLKITPKYLSEIVRNASGRTAGRWVSLMAVMEIKSMLRNSDMTVKEIAQEMNFPTQSLLGRYFKNFTGMSPLDYRHK